jgi:hypothetical protein
VGLEDGAGLRPLAEQQQGVVRITWGIVDADKRYMYVCVYLCMYIYVCIYTCEQGPFGLLGASSMPISGIHTERQTDTQTDRHTQTDTHTHMHTCTQGGVKKASLQWYIYISVCVCVCIYMYMIIHTHTHTQTHTHTHTHIGWR